MKFRLCSAGVLPIVLAAMSAAAPLQAQGAYAASDNLAYTGSVSCYGSLADALAQTNSTCASSTVTRDLGIYFVDNNAAFAGIGNPASESIMLTNWYSNGGNNPNNTNVGFFQMYDNDAGSVTSMALGWTDPSLTNFSLDASGGPTITGCDNLPPEDCGRLWNGATSANGGSFISWNINAVFSGLTPATYDPLTGVDESISEPTSVSGTVTGIFADATTGQYYDLNATIDGEDQSWSVANGYSDPSAFGAAAPVTATPEPATLGLMATGLFGVGGLGRFKFRRRKSAA